MPLSFWPVLIYVEMHAKCNHIPGGVQRKQYFNNPVLYKEQNIFTSNFVSTLPLVTG